MIKNSTSINAQNLDLASYSKSTVSHFIKINRIPSIFEEELQALIDSSLDTTETINLLSYDGLIYGATYELEFFEYYEDGLEYDICELINDSINQLAENNSNFLQMII
jgi:hypothetical protein